MTQAPQGLAGRSDNLRGALWMVTAMAGFAVEDMFFKRLFEKYGVKAEFELPERLVVDFRMGRNAGRFMCEKAHIILNFFAHG